MKKLFELIKLYWGYIATVAAIAGSAWGLKSDIEKKAIKEYSGQAKDIQMTKDVKETKQAVDSILLIVRTQEGQISTVIEKQDEQKEAYNALRKTVLDHIGKDKAMTIEQFKQYIESTPELKKNFQPIVQNIKQQ